MSIRSLDSVINIYWNNPACLQKAVDKTLRKTSSDWELQGKGKLLFEQYSMFEGEGLDEKLMAEISGKGLEADIVISTDMKLFYSRDYLLGQTQIFEDTRPWVPLKEDYHQAVHPQGIFQPVLFVPLLIIKNKETAKDSLTVSSWQELLLPKIRKDVALSDYTKPAGKAILDTLSYLYGRTDVEEAKNYFMIFNSPAAVFDAVDRGKASYGIVPLLFASGSGRMGQVEKVWPREGVITVISYLAVKKSANPHLCEALLKSVLSPEMQDFYARRGCMFPVHPQIEPNSELREKQPALLFPSWEFILNSTEERK